MSDELTNKLIGLRALAKASQSGDMELVATDVIAACDAMLAANVAAPPNTILAERERCAKIVDEKSAYWRSYTYQDEAIRLCYQQLDRVAVAIRKGD